MSNPKKLFHQLSYLQYPLMFAGLIYCYKPFFNNFVKLWSDFNIGLVFLGFGISFSTLQDTTKTQNKLSKRIFENEKYAKRFLVVIFSQVLFFSGLGVAGLFLPDESPLKSLSFGIISIGIGTIGILKSAGEMAEHHRKILVTSEKSTDGKS